MKKKIYITAAGPSENELIEVLSSFDPSISESTKKQILTTFSEIRRRLQDSILNNPNFTFHQSQTISDGNHTITLVGQPTEPSFLKKLLDLI